MSFSAWEIAKPFVHPLNADDSFTNLGFLFCLGSHDGFPASLFLLELVFSVELPLKIAGIEAHAVAAEEKCNRYEQIHLPV